MRRLLPLLLLAPALALAGPGYDPAPKGGRLVFDDSGTAPATVADLCKRPALPVFFVGDYGAVPDDGGDDTPAFRAALADAQKAGGVVYCPKGVYDLCPQPGDRQTNEQPVLPVTASGVVFQGEGAGVTTLRFWCAGLADPKTTWRVTGDSYWKISRGGMFSCKGSSKAPLAGFQVRGMTLDGQCPYTGDSRVGGDPATGDGWDMSHKAVLTAGAVDKVLLLNVETVNWRGEHLYCGGGSGSFAAVNCWCHGSNASAVSVTADFAAVGCTLGGPGPGDDVYNGFENFATAPRLGTRLVNCLVRCGSASAHGNGAALLGVPGSKTSVTGCTFVNCGKAVLASEVLSDFTFQNNTLSGCGGGLLTSILGLYPSYPRGFDHWLIDGNAADNCGVFLNVQSHGPGPVDPLAVSNNTLTTKGALAAGSFGNTLPATFAFAGNSIGPGCKDVSGTWNGVRGLWSGTARPAGTGSYAASVNDYNAASTQTVVAPVSDGVVLNDHRTPAGTPHYATLDPAALPLYPVGYAVTFYQGPAKRAWLLKADPAWNTLPADVPVTAAGGVTLVFDGKLFNPK
jgi:hypothetical protein